MKRGTESRVFLGKDTTVDEFTGINVLSTVLLGKKEGGFKDHDGLFIASNVTLGKGIARIITVVVYGTSPLSLPNAIEADVVSLKAFGGTEQETETIIQTATAQGKTEQRNLPDGYTQYDGLIGDGSAYIDLGCTLDENDEIEVEFTTNATTVSSINIFGYRNSASSQAITAMISSTDNQFICDFNNSGYTPYRLLASVSTSTRYKLILNKTGRYLYQGSTLVASNTTACPDTITTGNAYLFNIGGTPAYTNKFSGTIHRCLIKGKRDVVPCGNGTTYGVYDKLNGVFYPNVNTAGTFTAGGEAVPTPQQPLSIISNNGVLKARHQSGLPLGYTLLEYIESTGTQYIDTGIIPDYTQYSYSWQFKMNNSKPAMFMGANGNMLIRYENGRYSIAGGQVSVPYTLNTDLIAELNVAVGGARSGTVNGTSLTGSNASQQNKIYIFNLGSQAGFATAGKIYYSKIYRNGSVIQDLVPAKRNSDNELGMYDLVSGQFFTNQGTGTFTAGTAVSDPVEIYTDGTVETIKDSLNNTATAEMLLKVDTYQDVQSIIDGVVTRNVGVKVLDGTENWVAYNGGVYFPLGGGGSLPATTVAYCSHFGYAGSGVLIANLPMGDFTIATNGNCSFKSNDTATLSGWTNWLKEQYTAGTPVIIVYPLATATTETVTGQNLRKEPLTVTGSLPNLLVNTTTGDAVPTPEYPLDIVSNNGVLKYGFNYYSYNVTRQLSVENYPVELDRSISYSNGVLTCGITGSVSSNRGLYPTWDMSFTAGHKYACIAMAKGDTRINLGLATIIPSGSVTGGSSSDGFYTLTNNFVWYAKRWECNTDSSARLNIRVAGTDVGQYASFKDILVIDLTAIFGAGNEPTTSSDIIQRTVEIYTDGTVETIWSHTKNLFDNTPYKTGYYIDASGNEVEATQYQEEYLIRQARVQPSTQYTISLKGVVSGYTQRIHAYDAAGNWLSQVATISAISPGVVSYASFTTPANCAYVRQGGRSQTEYQLEKGSTATAYVPYYDGGTATAEMLLKVGDYQDVQSIIDGVVTRKVGIKVLDGTENWAVNSMISHHFTCRLPNQFDSSVAYKPTYCTHFLSDSGVDNNTCKLQYRLFSIRYDAANENINIFKQYLADQYAAGTPVIVIYPLATATTESVTGQPMATTQGDNIAEITQASMDGLTLEVTYLAGATVTIQEVENAQLSDDVDVTIH